MATPRLYGSSRLFWYQLVTGILNGGSIVVLSYFLYMRAKAGSTAVWHFFAAFERCLPAWWKQRRLAAERESVAQLVTSAIALSYVLQSLTLITGPGPFPSKTACAIVGGMNNYTGLLNIGFSGFLAPYMSHKLVVRHKQPENVAKTLGSCITFISTVSFVITLAIALGTQWQRIGQVYGRAGCWCWIQSGDSERAQIRALVLAMGTFYAFAFFGMIYSGWVLREMNREVAGLRAQTSPNRPRLERVGSLYLSAETSRENVARRLTMAIYLFIGLWMPPLIVRILYFGSQVSGKNSPGKRIADDKQEVFALILVLEICVSIQGLLFGLVCMLSDATLKAMMSTRRRRRESQINDSGASLSRTGSKTKHPWALFRRPHKSMRFLRLAQQRQASNYKLDRRLVVATLNCAERRTVAELCGGDTRNALADLLPRGADVYALGVQECQCWSELRQAVLAHLGDEFVALGTAQLGAAFLKGTIGIVLFATRDDVDAGFVALGDPGGGSAMVHDDAATGLARRPGTAIVPLGAGARGAHTKGAACVRVRVGDSWMAFLACHLPADAAGNARRRQRRASLAHVLQSCGRQLEPRYQSAGAAAQHAFVLGDLNFRAVDGQLAAPENGAVRRGINEGWEAALKRDDELRNDMQTGKCLCSFREAEHYFPPTFKRRPGVVFDPTDAISSYAVVKVADDFREDSPQLKRTSTKSLDDKLRRAREDLHRGRAPSAAAVAVRHGLRYPSWTDRVLFGALPRASGDFEAVSYDVAEELIGTDHRGVVLTAVLKADATRARLYARASSGLPSRKELGESGFATLAVTVSAIAVAWEESATEDDVEALRGSVAADEDDDDVDLTTLSSGANSSKLTSALSITGRRRSLSGDSRVSGDSRESKKQPARRTSSLLTSSLEALHVSKTVKTVSSQAFDDDDVDRLCLAFPLPCEDPLASARRARTVARDLDGFEGLTRKSDKSCGFYEQTFEAPWSERAESATAAHAHPSLARHALLSVMRPDRSVFAAAIVPLPPPPAPPVNLSRSGSRRLLDVSNAVPDTVSVPLTRGGRLVGTLTATVSLVVSRPD